MSIFYTPLFSFLSFLLLFSALTWKSLYWLYLWQLKEYRWDRMKDFFSTSSGKKVVFHPLAFIELITIGILLLSLDTSAESYAIVLFCAVMGVQTIRFFQWRVSPIWTPKMNILSAFCFFLLWGSVFIFSLIFEPFLAAALIFFLAPIMVSMVILIFEPFFTIQKRRVIAQAKQKIDAIHPTVIGITGSYGKTSTKVFLKTMLEKQFQVLATPKNINVDIGVARIILNELTDAHEVCIIEMGAYREGEIDSICNLVSPTIGVITAINPQHLSLFGSIESIKKAKGELVRALPSSGVAIFNKDNADCIEIAETTRAKKIFFSKKDIADVYASDIHVTPHQVEFTLHIQQEQRVVSTSLHGGQVVHAILAAAAVADTLGVSIDDIAAAMSQLSPIEGTMQLRNGLNGAYVIDDHYNANPDGFLAAIDYLDIFEEKRKIIITPGMQELGSESDTQHRNVGSHVGEIADLLIITKKDFAAPLSEAAKKNGLSDDCILVDDDPTALIRFLQEHITERDVILIEGRIQASLLSALLSS